MLGFNVRVGDGGRPRISPTVRFGNIGFTKQPRPLRHVHRPRTPSPPPPAPPSNHPQENERQLDVEGFTEDDWEALQLSIVMEESRRDAAGRGGDRTGVEAGASSDAGASTGTGASARDPPEQAPPPPYGALDLGGWYDDDDDDDAPPRHLGIEAGIEAQRTFGCGICLDRHSSEDVAEVDPCGHEFCRDCLRSYVSTQIGSRRFPIVCPLCSTERDAGQAGEVSELLIEMLGIPEHEFAIYSELQLSQFSVQVHCRRCGNTVNMDREEFTQNKVLECPLPQCQYKWCKNCNRALGFERECNNCDGTRDLEILAASQGWKRCPGCSTVVQKNEGCNHMTCITPGCNVHFCYVCGQQIIRGYGGSTEVQGAVRRHYSGFFSCRQ